MINIVEEKVQPGVTSPEAPSGVVPPAEQVEGQPPVKQPGETPTTPLEPEMVSIPRSELDEKERRLRGADQQVSKVMRFVEGLRRVGGMSSEQIEETGQEGVAEMLGLTESDEEPMEQIENAVLKESYSLFDQFDKIPAHLKREVLANPLGFISQEDKTSEDAKASIKTKLRGWQKEFGGEVPEAKSTVKDLTHTKEKAAPAALSNAERIVEMMNKGQAERVHQLAEVGEFSEKDLAEATRLQKEQKK